ncbi:hypothetical protein FDO65_10055 [Nakamurella flava]|uniref:Uncharacterized protein n=1 Tax=Nakamurella flava TaxID=2576308 RepID=A0A4U6QN85_9ACTN|nr:hypothetical protein [Nakamurella flava]TKV61859.1 hypothetical protein FDO65_10055 [Nakamurella flava]
MQLKECEQCGTQFEARKSTAKYCSGNCRTRASRNRTATGINSAGQPAAAQPKASGGVVLVAGEGLVAQVQRELQDAGRLDTVLGQQALVLAQRMRVVSPDTGSSLSAISKELRTVMAQALDGVAIEGDPIDEVTKRREAKMARLNAG